MIVPTWAEADVERLKAEVALNAVKPKVAKRTRRAKFVVDWSFDGTKAATMVINMGAGTITVRPFHKRRSYELPLADVALMIAQRVCKADLKAKARAKKIRRKFGG